FEQGRQCEASGDWQGALDAYEQAGAIDDGYADLAFCRARCLKGLGRIEDARQAFEEARDLDTLRFRADSSIEKAIRDAAGALGGQGVHLCDLTAALEEKAQDGLLGDDLLLDHVHLNFRGNFLAALAAMERIREAIPEAKLVESERTEAELLKGVRDCLLFGNKEIYEQAMMMYRRKTLPPFAGQITHEAELRRLREGLFALRRLVKDRETTEDGVRAAVEQAPLDPYLNVRYGQFLLDQGRIGDAVRHYQRALESRPYDMTLRLAMARACAQAGMKDQDIEHIQFPECKRHF
ncbi:MAG: tetratricopeptide repeat protein, partial [Bacillota bacterium]